MLDVTLLTPVERDVLRELGNPAKRWYSRMELIRALQYDHERTTILAALGELHRRDLATATGRDDYAITTLGEGALRELDRG